MLNFPPLSLALFIARSAPAFAQELGTITAELDGEAREWFTIGMERGGEVHASASLTDSGVMTDLHLQGHPRPSFTSTDVLTIDAIFLGEFAPDAQPQSVEVMHLPEGMSSPFWTSDGAPTPATLSFDTFEGGEPGETGQISGRFEAEICRMASITAEPDTSDCRRISGRFETQLVME